MGIGCFLINFTRGTVFSADVYKLHLLIDTQGFIVDVVKKCVKQFYIKKQKHSVYKKCCQHSYTVRKCKTHEIQVISQGILSLNWINSFFLFSLFVNTQSFGYTSKRFLIPLHNSLIKLPSATPIEIIPNETMPPIS